MNRIGVAFVGISHPHSSARYRCAADRPDVEIIGAWDEDPTTLEAFCAEVGATPITWEQVVADERIHAAAVHSKSKDMVRLAMLLGAGGRHVLIEKPGGASDDDLRDLARFHREHQVVMRVGYQFHFSDSLARAHALLADGAIGRISLIRGHSGCAHSEHLSPHLNQEADMGGGLWVIGCHVVHPILDLFGAPSAVRASVEKLPALSDRGSREDVASLTLLYPDRIATLDFTVHENGDWFESSEVQIYGDHGQIDVGLLPARISWQVVDDDLETTGWSSWSEGPFSSPWTGAASPFSDLKQVANREFFDAELAEFFDAIKEGRRFGAVTPQLAYEVAAVIRAAYRSAEKNGAQTDVVIDHE